MPESTENYEIQKEAESMRSGFQSIMMATVDDQNFPEISYASYVENDGKFYIFISELAAHTKNLMNNGKASVMFIEEETKASHIFARKRQTYACKSERVSRDHNSFNYLIEKMQIRFGNLIETLRNLNDFHLFELTPLNGQYVAGFGKTYEIDVSTAQFRLVTEEKIRGEK